MYSMRALCTRVLGIVACFSLSTNIASASVADKGVVCRDETQFQARFSDLEPPLLSLVAHWFDDTRVNTTTWKRINDSITMSTSRRGVPYETNVKEVSWRPDANDKERKISIDRKTVRRSVVLGEKVLVSVNCQIFYKKKDFDSYLKGVTKSLQTKYDAEIADHRL
ncbi:MAG: hypothetical protein ACJ0BO_01680 [Candidatus Puniceispirillaceae bacterium]